METFDITFFLSIRLAFFALVALAVISASLTGFFTVRKSSRKRRMTAGVVTGISTFLAIALFGLNTYAQDAVIEPTGGVAIDARNYPDATADYYNSTQAESEANVENAKPYPEPVADSNSLDAGGRANVNDRPYGQVFAKDYGTNPFIDTDDDNLSTFAIDVDTASYSVARKFILEGHMPYPELVRTEEFVNYFDYDYPQPPPGDVFAIHLEGAPSPFGLESHTLLRVGIQAKDLQDTERDPTTIILTIDTSGSMQGEGRLRLAKDSAQLMLDHLQPQDRVAIVTYGADTTTVLRPTPAQRTTDIREALESLYARGSTNAVEGLKQAYRIADREADTERTVRVILMSDGVANVGLTGPDSILESVKAQTENRVYLSTIGLGMGTFNDVLMEQLANDGNGTYHYADTIHEAKRVMVRNLTGLLLTVADETKVQVEFNPDSVRSYRLIGYENRAIRDEQFRDDSVDAGEVGAGHSAIALYEIKLHQETDQDHLATVRLRFKDPSGGPVQEISNDFLAAHLQNDPTAASPAFKLAAGVAEYAEILGESYWAQDSSMGAVKDWSHAVFQDHYLEDPDVLEFVSLLEKANQLHR